MSVSGLSIGDCWAWGEFLKGIYRIDWKIWREG